MYVSMIACACTELITMTTNSTNQGLTDWITPQAGVQLICILKACWGGAHMGGAHA